LQQRHCFLKRVVASALQQKNGLFDIRPHSRNSGPGISAT
jgi:hypothetical protein